jgi:hypothetical protein
VRCRKLISFGETRGRRLLCKFFGRLHDDASQVRQREASETRHIERNRYAGCGITKYRFVWRVAVAQTALD